MIYIFYCIKIKIKKNISASNSWSKEKKKLNMFYLAYIFHELVAKVDFPKTKNWPALFSIYPAFIASDKDKYPPLREKQPPFEFSCKKRAVYKFDDLKAKNIFFLL